MLKVPRSRWILVSLAVLAVIWFVRRHPETDDRPPPPAKAELTPRERQPSSVESRSDAAPHEGQLQTGPSPTTAPATAEGSDSDDAERAAATRVIDELDGLITASAIHDVTTRVEGSEIVIVAPAGICTAALLRELGDTLVSFQLDPGRSYSGLRCAGTNTTFTLR